MAAQADFDPANRAPARSAGIAGYAGDDAIPRVQPFPQSFQSGVRRREVSPGNFRFHRRSAAGGAVVKLLSKIWAWLRRAANYCEDCRYCSKPEDIRFARCLHPKAQSIRTRVVQIKNANYRDMERLFRKKHCFRFEPGAAIKPPAVLATSGRPPAYRRSRYSSPRLR